MCFIVVCPYTTKAIVLNIYIYIFAPLQLSSQRTFLGRKNIGGAFAPLPPPHPPPNLRLWSHRRYPICNINLKRLPRPQLCNSFLRPASIDAAVIIFPHGATAPSRPGLPHCPGLTIALRHVTIDRTK